MKQMTQDQCRARFLDTLQVFVYLLEKIDNDTPALPGQDKEPNWWLEMRHIERQARSLLERLPT